MNLLSYKSGSAVRLGCIPSRLASMLARYNIDRHDISSFGEKGFEFFTTTLSLPPVECNYHFNLQFGIYVDTKKPAKKSFRVLAGVSDKPKRLCAT